MPPLDLLDRPRHVAWIRACGRRAACRRRSPPSPPPNARRRWPIPARCRSSAPSPASASSPPRRRSTAGASSLALTDGHLRGGTVGRAEAHQSATWWRSPNGAASAGRCTGTPAACACRRGRRRSAKRRRSACAWRAWRLRDAAGHLVSGPRGCFGAPSVIAAVGHATFLTARALWGLTGPQLLEGGAADHDAARAVMAAPARRRAGHASGVVEDTATAVRQAIAAALARAAHARRRAPRAGARARGHRPPARPARSAASADAAADGTRQRDLFAYSFRGQWRTTEPSVRLGLVHAAWGELRGTRTLGIIVGPERSPHGIGVADAHAVLQAVHQAVRTAPGRRSSPSSSAAGTPATCGRSAPASPRAGGMPARADGRTPCRPSAALRARRRRLRRGLPVHRRAQPPHSRHPGARRWRRWRRACWRLSPAARLHDAAQPATTWRR